jgi:hypothetical protein
MNDTYENWYLASIRDGVCSAFGTPRAGFMAWCRENCRGEVRTHRVDLSEIHNSYSIRLAFEYEEDRTLYQLTYTGLLPEFIHEESE